MFPARWHRSDRPLRQRRCGDRPGPSFSRWSRPRLRSSAWSRRCARVAGSHRASPDDLSCPAGATEREEERQAGNDIGGVRSRRAGLTPRPFRAVHVLVRTARQRHGVVDAIAGGRVESDAARHPWEPARVAEPGGKRCSVDHERVAVADPRGFADRREQDVGRVVVEIGEVRRRRAEARLEAGSPGEVARSAVTLAYQGVKSGSGTAVPLKTVGPSAGRVGPVVLPLIVARPAAS